MLDESSIGMALKSKLLSGTNRILRGAGLKLLRTHSLYPWQVTADDGLAATQINQGPQADDRLETLRKRYRQVDPRVTTPLEWDEGMVTADHLRNFRGDNPYVWQRVDRNANDVAYALTYYSLKSRSDLIDRLQEDGAFGARTIEIDGRPVSRDLLDSVSEIDFLIRHFGTRFSILDVGAGYGRLAHRLSEATDASIWTTDAFAPSTFLSEFYLDFRGARATVVPLDEIEGVLKQETFDVATNVHSFSECQPEAIEWWTERLASAGVRHLMSVPNAGYPTCVTNAGKDMESIFARYGYDLVVREPRHPDPLVHQYGLDPSWFNLFRLNRAS